MADDHFFPGLENLKQAFSLADCDPNLDLINHFPGIIPGQPLYPSAGLSIHNPTGFPLDNNLFSHFPDQFPGLSIHEDNNSVIPPFADSIISNDNDHADRKRKAMAISTGSTSSSPQASDNIGIRKKNGAGRGKKFRNNEKKEEKSREVVHVRAKRGQATDSHSLAERVRREKINERLRCLQDLVPGCYKTMGMSVMLDEIINYVQSLQKQVEFLSMKLTAASTFYDFNSETDALETIQRAKAFEASKIIQNGASTATGLHSAQFPQSALNFGYFPQLPHNN